MQRTMNKDSDEILKKYLWTFIKLKRNTGRMGKDFFLYSNAMESSIEEVKASGQTLCRFNAMPNKILGIRILRDNGQDQIIRSGN